MPSKNKKETTEQRLRRQLKEMTASYNLMQERFSVVNQKHEDLIRSLDNIAAHVGLHDKYYI